MAVSPDLTAALKKVVLTLEDDLRGRVAALPEVDAAWRGQHAQAVDRERTAMSWQAWRDDRVTQAAVAWVLTSVFVRFCEDNRLLKPVWIAGPGSRRQEALDAQLQYFRANPEHTDREWLLQAIDHLAGLRATRELVGAHSPLWTVSPSGQAVQALLSFWRETRDDGTLVWDLADPDLSTRFLGDLYQNLSDYAKKTFALLQTPEFVEEFILDQTMEPALAERPLEGFRMIDPTCGSGHFLLGAFARLNARWAAHAPGLEPRARVQKALDAVHGVDLNPFAVAIARFRLMVAALQACGEISLEDAPGFTFHLAAGDSLLHGGHQLEMRFEGFDAASEISGFAYDTEDLDALRTLLAPGRYDTVVGNPPYITVKDKTLNAAYREFYSTCKGKYALTIPFMERFFQLAKRGTSDQSAGWTGQITSNSFMKREFGSKLIEEFLSRQDLRLVVDTSGAYIPGHGTPTVILVGRHRPPADREVQAVLGVRGEPGQPADPAAGLVWSSIAEHSGDMDFENDYITVTRLGMDSLSTHPWSLSGGGAPSVLARIESAKATSLAAHTYRVGVFGIMGADDAFMVTDGTFSRRGLEGEATGTLVIGDQIRDFSITSTSPTWFPYDDSHSLLPLSAFPIWSRHLWPCRTELGNRATFTKGTYFSDGRAFYEWHQLPKDPAANDLTITFAFVATHNHFVLDRGGKVFKQSAPVIKLPKEATEDDHLALLGVLNSSTACFWLKQNSHDKGNGGYGGGIASTEWERFYEFTGTTLKNFPLPRTLPLDRARKLDMSASQVVEHFKQGVGNDGATPSLERLKQARTGIESTRGAMIAVQEELDWEVYRAYGLINDDLTIAGNLPEIQLGERTFEIALARKVAANQEDGEWFPRHGSMPITEIPTHWPEAYRALVQRRLDAIESNKFIRLLEKPEYKRRWATEPWEKQVERALRGWLLDRLEDRRFWFDGAGRPQVRSVGQLADDVSRDGDLTSVLELWSGTKDQSVTSALSALLDTESVPYLAAHRLKDPGLRKREAWEHTWDLQRREDAGEKVGDIPVPPKYTSADFRKTHWWQHRGKLDVPKERFILYPGAGRETDPTAVLGWAGWGHAQQALALASLIQDREADGWDDDRLVPLVAGLAELQPWVRQWHDETDLTFQVNLADYLDEELRNRASQVGRTLDELKAWRPPAPTRGRRPRA
ncbi:MAG TPA: BREX-2 system adenine-specific DNA-methyltransferase PglX [Propioniciclava tarda]|nr:BREX-2 system adenine-specific DNA-methyltransferase PglX [Propioniciclava tarda]